MLPPLRERQNDIPLARAILLADSFAVQERKDLGEISSGAMRLLLDYSWPGNVRELENAVEHAVVLAKGSHLETWDLPLAMQQPLSESAPDHGRSANCKPCCWTSWKNAAGIKNWRLGVWA
jgi:DNA-binding NtrC family response regulator